MNKFWLLSLLWSCVCGLSVATATAGDTLVGSVPNLRPVKLCAANALNLSQCARDWQSLVGDGIAPKSIENTWNAAEFEGIVYGFTQSTNALAAKPGHGECARIFESNDEVYEFIAKDLIAHAERLTINDDTIDYLRKATHRLLSCR